MKILKRIGIVAGALLAVLIVVAGVLVVWKPWAPEIQVADPGPEGRRITAEGILANYYPGEQGSPGILLLGGSGGGISPYNGAQTLHEQGYSVLALSYWGGEGQSKRMENLPLEYFDTALEVLARQPEVNPDKIGIYGGSKGAEAALLIASRNPMVKAVVANAPTHVAWAGIDLREPWRMLRIGSTWSVGGRPIDYVPYGGKPASWELVDRYEAALEANPEAEERAAIPVENTTAPVIMVCGKQDTM